MDTSRLTEHLSDEECIARVLNGDTQAFGILFDRYRYLVHRLAYDMLKENDLAEDVIQDVFIAAYRNLDRLREPAAFSGWLSTIARNRCRNVLRSMKLKQHSLDSMKEEYGYDPPAPEPEEDESEAHLALVMQTLPRLPAKYRQIVELRYIQNLTYQQIEEALGISMSAVKSRLFHARKKLIRLVEKRRID